MKLKFKHIALAAALVATGAAQAKIADSNDNALAMPTSGGDMFASLVSVSNNASFTVDLGLRLDQFIATVAPTQLGVNLVWNLANSTFTDGLAPGYASTGLAGQMQALNYGSVYTTFATPTVIGATDLKFDVKAMDGTPTFSPGAGTNRYLSTAAASSITATNGQVFNMKNYDTYPTAANGDTTNSTHGADFNIAGANMYDNGDATNVYFQNHGDNWKGFTSFTSTGAVSPTAINGGELSFYFLTNSSSTAAQQATVEKYAGVWSFDVATAQLSYVTAPVPEAETYAMLLAGLGLMGAIVRRRNKSA
jgi:hypothetical protein